MDRCEDQHLDISIKVEPISCCCDGDTEQTPFLRHCLDDAQEQHNQHSCGKHHYHHSSDGHHHSTEEQHHLPAEKECCSASISNPCQEELSTVWVQGSPRPSEDGIESIDMNEQDANYSYGSDQANLRGSMPEKEVIDCNGHHTTDVDSNGCDVANANKNIHETAKIPKNRHDLISNRQGSGINSYEIASGINEMINSCSNEHKCVNIDSNELDTSSAVDSCLCETANSNSKTDLHDILLWSNKKYLSSHDLETDRKKCSQCHIKSAAGDSHPNCLGHSRCFKRYIWDPRYCDYCNGLKRRAERGEETALRIYKKRIKNMGKLAIKHRTSNHWIHPLASHYRVGQHGFATDAGVGSSGSNHQQNISSKEQLDRFVSVKEEVDFLGFEVEETPSTSEAPSSSISEVPFSSTFEVPPSSTSEVPLSFISQVANLPYVDARPPSIEMEVLDKSCVAPTSHDRTPPTDSSSLMSRKCNQCAAYVTLGDTHPNCLTHSSCFKNFTWDPRSCSFCNELREGAVKGDIESWNLYKRRYQNMIKRARVHGNLQTWINPLAVDCILPITQGWLGFNPSLEASSDSVKASATTNEQPTSAEFTAKDIALDQRHDKIFKDSVIKKRNACNFCHVQMTSDDEHPNCIRHSDCFKNYTWEPRICQHCIALKLKAENDDAAAAKLFADRVKRMRRLAWENGVGFSAAAPNWLTKEKVADEAHRAYRKLCGVCRIPIASTDSHPNCSRHSQCFRNGVWDPRQCGHCLSLRRLAKQGQEEAVKRSRKRLQNMRISAKKKGLVFSTTAPAWLNRKQVVSEEASHGSVAEVECKACLLIHNNGDPHTGCVRHSACFRNNVWDPRCCLPCNELRRGAKQGDMQAKAVYRARFVRMRRRAWLDGVMNSRWIHQTAAAFHLTNVFPKAGSAPAGKQTDPKASDHKTGTKKLDSVMCSTERPAGKEEHHLPAIDNTFSISQLTEIVPANNATLWPSVENSRSNETDQRPQQIVVNKLLTKATTRAVTNVNSVSVPSEEHPNDTTVKSEPNGDEICKHLPDVSLFPDVSNKLNRNTPKVNKMMESNSPLFENPPNRELNFVFQDVGTKTSRTATETDPRVYEEGEEVDVDTRSWRPQKETHLNASRQPSKRTEQVRILVARLHKLTEFDITARFCCDHDLGLLNGVEILMGLRQLEKAGANFRKEGCVFVDEESLQLDDGVLSDRLCSSVPDTTDAGATAPEHGGPKRQKSPSSTTRFITSSPTTPSATRSTDSSATPTATSSVTPVTTSSATPTTPPSPTASALPFDNLCLDSVRVSGTLFKCPVCHKTVKSLNKYRYHYMVHSMEKPHQCSKCPLAFRQPIHLKRHDIRAHNYNMAKSRKKLKLLVRFPRMSPPSRKEATKNSVSSSVSTYLPPLVSSPSVTSPQPLRISSGSSDTVLFSDALQRQVTVQLTKSPKRETVKMGQSSSKPSFVATTKHSSVIPTATNNKAKVQVMPLKLMVPALTTVVPYHQLELNQFRLPKAGCHQCPVCGKIFKGKREFRSHYMIHSDEMPYSCPLCQYMTRSKSNLRQHIKKYHPDHISAPSKFQTPAVPFNQLGTLALKGADGLYKCPVCLKTSKNLSEFRAHYMIHSNEYPYHCRQCQFKCRLASRLKRHVGNMHGNGSAKQKSASKDSESEMFHLVSKGSGSAMSKQASKGSESTMPKLIFKGNGSAMSKLVSKGSGSTMPKLMSKGNGRTMPKLEAKGNGSATPKLESRGYGSVMSTLAPKKGLQGPRASKSFTSSAPPFEKMFPALVRKPGEAYRCPVCRKEYKDKRLFKSHYMNHSGEKPFECKLCLFRTNHRCSLTGHRYLHHPNEYPRPVAAATES